MTNQTSFINDADLDAVSGGTPMSAGDARTLSLVLNLCADVNNAYGNTGLAQQEIATAIGVRMGAGIHPK
jgi:hypothetical protein